MNSKFAKKYTYLAYILLAPSIVIVAVFLIYPSIQSLYLSFYRTTPFGNRIIFTGLQNFTRLLTSDAYWNSLGRSLSFTAITVFLAISISLLLAVLTNKNIRGAKIYKSLMIWPFAFSFAFAGTIWGVLLHPNVGVMSYYIELITGFGFNWVNNGTAAFILLIIASTWRMIGYNVIFFIAALQNVSPSLLEAAEIDGANNFTKFWKITFPLISPITFFLLIMNTLQVFFLTFGIVDVLTQGGPARATDIVTYKLFRDAFLSMRTGYASAQSIILFVIVAAITIFQFKYAGKKVFYQ
ncbi:MAG: carbohydrate ABC transporter permease [Bacillota bacterium]